MLSVAPREGLSQAPPDTRPAPANHTVWHSDRAEQLIGLEELKPKLKGSLALSPTELIFTTPSGQTVLERAHIVAVSTGGERKETGGFVGKVARKAIPYGGGSALALVTQTQVDLLTVEYRDMHDAYHGVVFLLPKTEAAAAKAMFGSDSTIEAVEQPKSTCAGGQVQPSTLKILTISSEGVPVPAEYKVLLYEQLVRRLTEEAGYEHIFRDGDSSKGAACPELSLAINVEAFNKGNAVFRASTGLLGMFVGTTSLKFHMTLRDASGQNVIDKELKKSERGDSENLDVADDIAKNVRGKLKKQRKEDAKARTAPADRRSTD